MSYLSTVTRTVVAMVKSRLQSLFARLLPHRLWVQTGMLLVWLDPFKVRLHSVCAPVFHCYACPWATFACPIGVMAQFSALHIFPFLAVGTVLVAGALMGTLICAWICPFGWLQDLAAKVPLPKIRLPACLGHIRYVVLVATVIIVPYVCGEMHPLFVCRICPAGGLEAAVPGMVTQAVTGKEVAWPSALKLAVIVTFLATIVFVRRPWCRVFCPLGAILGLCNKVSAIFLRVDPSQCSDCKRCHRLCTYGILPDQSPNDPRCIRCLECTRCGPGAIQVGTVLDSDEAAQSTERTM